MGLKDIRGVVVGGFPNGVDSPAKKAGLEQGDVIITIDGQQVAYVAQLQQLVGFRHPGESVKVEVARKGGIRKTFTVRLMEQRDETPESPSARTVRSRRAIATPSPWISWEFRADCDPAVAEDYDLDQNTKGVLVVDVQPDRRRYETPLSADEGGPDIIQSVEGKPVKTEAELRDALKASGKGSIVTLKIFNVRVGQSRIERVKLTP